MLLKASQISHVHMQGDDQSQDNLIQYNIERKIRLRNVLLTRIGDVVPVRHQCTKIW